MNSRAWPGLLALVILLAASCQSGPSASGTKTEWFSLCEATAECPDNSECLCGVCTAECSSDDDCGQGLCGSEEASPQSCSEETTQQICLPSSQIPFSAPTPVELSVPGASGLDDPTFTEDQLELYFTVDGYPDSPGLARIWKSTRASATEPWGEPALVPELNDETGADSMPAVTSDGLTLYFVRHPELDGRHLYVATRSARDAEWSPPEAVTFSNDDGTGDSPSGTSDGLLLAWSRKVGDHSEIELAERATKGAPWEALGVIEELAGVGNYEPWLSDDGLTLFYRSQKDIYMTSRVSRDEPFAEPTLVEELSTDAFEGDPWLTQDTRNIMFASEQDDGSWAVQEAFR